MWHLSKIPKVMYFYWAAKKLSFLRYLSILSFVKLNPDWEVFVYTCATPNTNLQWGDKQFENQHAADMPDYWDLVATLPNVKVIEFDFQSIGFNNKMNEIYKADILRYWLLYKEGGFWADMDILFINQMENLKINRPNNSAKDAFCYIGAAAGVQGSFKGHAIGFLAGAKNNFYFRDVFNAAQKKSRQMNYEAFGAQLLNTHFDLRSVSRKYPSLGFLDTDSVYSIDHDKYPYIFFRDGSHLLNKHSIGIHWYGGSEHARELTVRLNQDNYFDYPNGSTLVKQINKLSNIMELKKQDKKPLKYYLQFTKPIDDIENRLINDEWYYLAKKHTNVAFNYRWGSQYYPPESGFKHLLQAEPAIEVPEQWNVNNIQKYSTILSWNRKFIKEHKGTLNLKFIHGCPGCNSYYFLEKHLPYRERINGILCLNKVNYTNNVGDIYYLRKEVMEGMPDIPGFEKHIYSRSPWGGSMYQGSIPFYHSHYENLKKIGEYKFCLAFESTYHEYYSFDFITERMFNCFKAKTIPIYFGCYNIESHVPKNLFIDYRDFNYDHKLLAEYLANFPEQKWIDMTEAAFEWQQKNRIGNIQDLENIIKTLG